MAGIGGAIVVVLKVILPMFGLDIPEETLMATITAGITIVGTIMLVVGQVRRPDLIGGVFRR